MTVVLAIDTADATTGVALAVDGQVRAQVVEASATRHSERLFCLIDVALRSDGLKRADLSCVAVTSGPGSFTGVRVGVATAKGIAFARRIPVVGVSSLEALARGAMPFPGFVTPLLDARKGQVYGAVYDGRSGEAVVGEGVWDPEAFAATVHALERTTLALGSGLRPYGLLFARTLGNRCLLAASTRWFVPPAEVALLGHRALKAGASLPAGSLAPAYYRLSEAEVSRGRTP